MKLNFSTAEEMIFWNSNVQSMLPPRYFSIFEQWRLSKRIPYLKEMGKQAVLDFLNMLGDDEIEMLEIHFGERIEVERLNYSTVASFKIPLHEVCSTLCDIQMSGYMGVWRDEHNLYLTIWR